MFVHYFLIGRLPSRRDLAVCSSRRLAAAVHPILSPSCSPCRASDDRAPPLPRLLTSTSSSSCCRSRVLRHPSRGEEGRAGSSHSCGSRSGLFLPHLDFGSVADPEFLYVRIPEPNVSIPDLGSERFLIRIRIFTQKNDLGCSFRIRIFSHPGSRDQKSTESRIRIRNTGFWVALDENIEACLHKPVWMFFTQLALTISLGIRF